MPWAAKWARGKGQEAPRGLGIPCGAGEASRGPEGCGARGVHWASRRRAARGAQEEERGKGGREGISGYAEETAAHAEREAVGRAGRPRRLAS
jgi:hypothetical protein